MVPGYGIKEEEVWREGEVEAANSGTIAFPHVIFLISLIQFTAFLSTMNQNLESADLL